MADAVHAMRVNIVRLLRRRGLWPEPGEEDPGTGREPDSLLPFLTAASIQGKVALGPEAGRPVERLRQPPTDAPRFEPGSLCATLDGFSLHAPRPGRGARARAPREAPAKLRQRSRGYV